MALAKAFAQAQERLDYRFGVIGCMIHNVNRDSDDAPVLQPHDLFPSSLPKPPARRERKQSPEEMLRFMRGRKNYVSN